MLLVSTSIVVCVYWWQVIFFITKLIISSIQTYQQQWHHQCQPIVPSPWCDTAKLGQASSASSSTSAAFWSFCRCHHWTETSLLLSHKFSPSSESYGLVMVIFFFFFLIFILTNSFFRFCNRQKLNPIFVDTDIEFIAN